MYNCNICRKDIERCYELFYNYRSKRYYLCLSCIEEFQIVFPSRTSMFLMPGPSRVKIEKNIAEAIEVKKELRHREKDERHRRYTEEPPAYSFTGTTTTSSGSSDLGRPPTYIPSRLDLTPLRERSLERERQRMQIESRTMEIENRIIEEQMERLRIEEEQSIRSNTRSWFNLNRG